MRSTFFGVEMGKRSLQQFQTALDVTGNNISNLKTKGYSRQRVTMRTLQPLYQPALDRPERPGQIGQGQVITEITRARDTFIDGRINFEQISKGYWNARQKYLREVEAVANEPGAVNLKSDLDAFWSGWEDLAANPAERPHRSAVLQRAERLTERIRHLHGQYQGIREGLNRAVHNKVMRINEIAYELRDINDRIIKLEALKDNPNDLYDRRDVLVEELSTLADASVANDDPNEFIVYIGGRHLVQGRAISDLRVEESAENEGMYDVYWNIDNEKTRFEGGEMKGLLEMRDVDLVHEINRVNSFAQNFADAVNEVHREGFGLNGETGIDFFKTHPLPTSTVGNYDVDEDGVADHTLLFKMKGVNEGIKEGDIVGQRGTLTFDNVTRAGARITVAYSPEQTVGDVVRSINESDANVSAYLDDRGRLVLKARVHDDFKQPNFMITHAEDSGEFLAGITGVLQEPGAAGAYDWNNVDEYQKLRGDGRHFELTPERHPAMYFQVNETLKNDTDYIAAASGFDTTGDGNVDMRNGVGNGEGAYAIAELRHNTIMIDKHSNINDFYADGVADIGARMERASAEVAKQDAIIEHLVTMRQSVSGVNLDEEMAQMVVFQHGYNANARVVSTMDRLLDTIINRMGV